VSSEQMPVSGKHIEAVGRDKISARHSATAHCSLLTAHSSAGWTLIELVIVMTVLAIFSVGVIPLVKTAVKRQHEYELRAALRQMRESIKEFHRDTVGMQCTGIGSVSSANSAPASGPQAAAPPNGPAAGGVNIDPR